MRSYDYVVVGAGSAGCALAVRLSASGASVLLIEAGKRHRRWMLSMPVAFFKAFKVAAYNWGYMSEPEPGLGSRQLSLARGKLLGGCSAINGMVYTRGHPLDYDEWARLGARGWDYTSVLPYFKRLESHWRGSEEGWGADGPVPVTSFSGEAPLRDLVLQAARASGLGADGDRYTDGFRAPDFNISKGRRAGVVECYLEPATGQANLHVVGGLEVLRIVVEKNRAIGVECVATGGGRSLIRAEREVIVSCGAYGSPRLLMLSGIGPEFSLRAAGIEPRHVLEGVGKNLQEHAAFYSFFDALPSVTIEHELRADRIAGSVLRWSLNGEGILGRVPMEAIGFLRTDLQLDRPNIETAFVSTAPDARVWAPVFRRGRGNVVAAAAILLRPRSRGSVELRSCDPGDPPRIRLNILSQAEDRRELRDGVRAVRELMRAEPLARVVMEAKPGAAIQSDADLDGCIREGASIMHHPVGTCALGVDEEAVVDPDLNVRGLAGLRVADASIMPRIIGGHTNAAAMMIGEKAADMILRTQRA